MKGLKIPGKPPIDKAKTHLNMRVNVAKTITISEEAYRLLLSEKREGESFSGVIIRLVKGNKGDIMDYAGIWKDMSDDEVRKLFEDLKKVWERRNED